MDPISMGMGAPKQITGNPYKFDLGGERASEAGGTKGSTFADSLTKALDEVNSLQSSADGAIEKMASGNAQDIHQVMVAFEQARLSMQMLVEVRNKIVDAYQEISRMQV